LSYASKWFQWEIKTITTRHVQGERRVWCAHCLAIKQQWINWKCTQATHTIEQLLHHCYDSSLILEPTSSITGTDRHFTYLDTTIDLTIEPKKHVTNIILSPYNKNINSIRTTGQQVIYHFQHWYSYSPTHVKFGVIKSTLLRYARISNSTSALLESISSLHHELCLLQYPPKVLLTIIQSLYCIHRDIHWLLAYYQLILINSRSN